jgi:4-amino-4-deoxy-L-arabinose transferase-like glycosyltransferase
MALKSKIALVFVCLGLAIFFSLYKLTESPPVWYDEGIFTQISVNSAVFSNDNIQVAPGSFVSRAFVNGGYTFLQPITWAYQIFGVGVLQSRIVMALFILALVLLMFFASYRMFGLNSAILATFLCVTFPVLYGNGKNVLGEVPGLVFLFIFLASVFEIEKRNFTGVWLYILAGLSGGLCLSTKPIFFLLAIATFVGVLIHRKSIRWNIKGLSLGLVSFIIPFSIWFYFQFRTNDSSGAILNYYANPYGLTDILGQIVTNALRFLHESSPIYLLVLTLIWAWSIWIRSRNKKPILLVEKITFSFSILVILAYLRTAGWYRYFFLAQVVTILFVPNSLNIIFLQYKKSLATDPKRLSKLAVWVCILLILFQGYQLLFTSWVAIHYQSHKTLDLQEFLATVPVQSTFFLYDAPELVEMLPNYNYYQYMEPTQSLNFGKEQIEKLDEGVPDIVICNGRKWEEAKTHMANYAELGIVGGFHIARHLNNI